ncbi:flagellar basal body-associated protein FliL [Idiomarina xiamenensis]|uniref:Flagellar protein FliL n=1 Tax=Idiomarina xiamenensis 10-D-4 TaxID=740709 RepID=K2KSD5_9GAMM|nr:flagellar basal body-associated protein FliL [Idiomarina xiamenensis]EKE80515.1 flagellar basal body-associated protein FliL [Idiomarina xiamenensis 10-D-4]
MAEEDEELALKNEQGGKKKWLLIGAGGVVVVLLVVVLLWLFSGDDSSTTIAENSASSDPTAAAASGPAAELGTALYVGMPRPFVFNVPGDKRDRLVQINVQLMVRGVDNEESAKKHIPLIEGTLLQVFSSTTAEALQTAEGKDKLRELALAQVQDVMQEIAGNKVVEKVLFTGFVLQ